MGFLFDQLITKSFKDIKIKNKNLLDTLRNRTPVYEEDPLILLNLYYRNFFQIDDKIDYYTFLYSLFQSDYKITNEK